MNKDEVEILEDLIVAAHNDAKAKSEAMMAEKMKSVTAGCLCRRVSSCRSERAERFHDACRLRSLPRSGGRCPAGTEGASRLAPLRRFASTSLAARERIKPR